LFPNPHPPHLGRRPHLRMLHVEAASVSRTATARSIGAAHERERPVGQVGDDPVGDLLVVAREVELGRADRREDDSIRMGDANACNERPIRSGSGGAAGAAIGTNHAAVAAVSMPDQSQRPVALELPWRTVLKVLGAVALVWCWLHLVSLILII